VAKYPPQSASASYSPRFPTGMGPGTLLARPPWGDIQAEGIMRTAFLGIFISLWLAVALYVALLALLSAMRRGRHESASYPTTPLPRFRSSS